MDKHPKHDWISEAIESIDRELARPPMTIDEALDEAIKYGRMDIKEAEQCREAYHRTLSGLPYDRGEVPPDLV